MGNISPQVSRCPFKGTGFGTGIIIFLNNPQPDEVVEVQQLIWGTYAMELQRFWIINVLQCWEIRLWSILMSWQDIALESYSFGSFRSLDVASWWLKMKVGYFIHILGF